MLTFHNDKAVKSKYVKRLKAHAKADEIVQGTAWENGKGCAVGCTLEKYDHASYETELGIPEWLARVEDAIFEGLPNKEAKKFAVDFLASIPVGVDLQKIKYKFTIYILKENTLRVKKLKISEELKAQVVSAVEKCIEVNKAALKTGIFDESAAKSAESAAKSAESAAWSAESAARSAAWSAAKSAESAAWSAGSAARSAAWSAGSAAWSAAWSAESAAWSAAWSAAYKRYAKYLLTLLKNSK